MGRSRYDPRDRGLHYVITSFEDGKQDEPRNMAHQISQHQEAKISKLRFPYRVSRDSQPACH